MRGARLREGVEALALDLGRGVFAGDLLLLGEDESAAAVFLLEEALPAVGAEPLTPLGASLWVALREGALGGFLPTAAAPLLLPSALAAWVGALQELERCGLPRSEPE